MLMRDPLAERGEVPRTVQWIRRNSKIPDKPAECDCLRPLAGGVEAIRCLSSERRARNPVTATARW